MKKRKLAILIPGVLLVLVATAAAVWYANMPREFEPSPPETFTLSPTETAGGTQPYPIVPDGAYYPEGYIGYCYPVRPELESWLAVRDPGPWHIQIPGDVIAGMSTEALAQSVVCYPWYGWQTEMMLSSLGEQPADFVRGWFERRLAELPAMQELARREDARQALEKLDSMYQAFSGQNHFNGIDPALILQSSQFGGPGIPENAHKQ